MNDSPSYVLPTIPYLVLKFNLTPPEARRLPAFKGSLLRGAFGNALRRTVCVTGPKQFCAECFLNRRCVNTKIFQTFIFKDIKLIDSMPIILASAKRSAQAKVAFDGIRVLFPGQAKRGERVFRGVVRGPAMGGNHRHFCMRERRSQHHRSHPKQAHGLSRLAAEQGDLISHRAPPAGSAEHRSRDFTEGRQAASRPLGQRDQCR